MKPEESLDGIVRGWYVGEKTLEGLMGGLSVLLSNVKTHNNSCDDVWRLATWS